MGLSANLSSHLDTSGTASTLTGQLDGPVQSLHGISVPVSPDGIQQATQGIGSADSSGIGAAISRIVERAGPIVGSLPVAGQVLGPLGTAVDLVEHATQQDLVALFQSLGDRLAAEIVKPGGTGLIGVLQRIMDALSSSPEGQLLSTLITTLTGSRIQIPSPLPVG